MAPSTAKEAYVTLCTNDSYAIGVLVWAESLREVGTTRQIVIMVTSGLSQKMKEELTKSADKVVEVNVLDSRDNVNLDLLARPDLGVTFTKLHCWRLTEYDKCVFMDADTLVLKNIDDLFEKEELSASPDPGWPDCFNSGVFVFKPSLETYQKLLKFAIKSGSFDGGDQGLLNSYYTNWNRISFLYNCVAQSFYSYLPAFKQFGKDVKVAHFIGAVKPWHHSFDASTGKVSESEFSGHCADFLRHWWNIFINKVHKRIPEGVVSPTFQTEKWSPGVAAGNFQPPSKMPAPYIPPSVETFYSPPLPTYHEPNVIVELKERKDYEFYETFYAEPPMRTKEEYVAPKSETYHAKEFHTVLKGFGEDKNEPIVQEELPALPRTVETYESTQPAVPLVKHDPPPPLVQDVYERNNDQSNFQKQIRNEINKEPQTIDSSASSIPNSPSSLSTSFKDFSTSSSPRRSSTPTRIETPFENSVISHGSDIVKAVVNNGCGNHTAEDCSFCKSREEEVAKCLKEKKKKKTKKRGRGEMRMRSQSLNIVYSDLNTDDSQRRFLWEQGQIDYMGIDKFDNIQRKLDSMMITPEPSKPKHNRRRDKRPSSRGSSEKSSTVSSEEQDTTESDKSPKSSSEISSKESSVEKKTASDSSSGVAKKDVKKSIETKKEQKVEGKGEKAISTPANKAEVSEL